MALSYPLDLLATWPGWVTGFELVYRQEQSRQANGVTRVKDLGTPLWRLTAQSKRLRPNAMDQWRARLNSLENGVKTMKGYPLSRVYPILHPNGGMASSGTIASIGAAGKAISLSGVSGLKLSAGDYVCIGSAYLHQVMESSVSGSSFEIRPALAPGVSTGASVSLVRPFCPMSLVPGSLSAEAGVDGRGTISFQALETRGS